MILFMEPEASVIVESGVDLTSEQMAELRELAGSQDVPADVALRARIVLWSGEGRRRKDIAELAGVAPLTVDRCKARYAERCLAGDQFPAVDEPVGVIGQCPAQFRCQGGGVQPLERMNALRSSAGWTCSGRISSTACSASSITAFKSTSCSTNRPPFPPRSPPPAPGTV
ncbi:hypothetical protein ACFY1B_45365 [Streptomyces mirabilis]|uniref:hypothetical protein n=1 Tax=Streptomyces mirabilis TaxID=68239 RepID=UPI0036B9CDE7